MGDVVKGDGLNEIGWLKANILQSKQYVLTLSLWFVFVAFPGKNKSIRYSTSLNKIIRKCLSIVLSLLISHHIETFRGFFKAVADSGIGEFNLNFVSLTDWIDDTSSGKLKSLYSLHQTVWQNFLIS